MKPGSAAVCTGTVVHRRTRPEIHQFTYPLHQLWFDPDNPAELTSLHPLWSHSGPSPARFRNSDYGVASTESLGSEVRSDLQSVLGFAPAGPVRVVTQVRRWGWLFNPITLFLAWDKDNDHPVGAVLEVTNTPWKERHRYPIALEREGGKYTSTFSKELHVSPFLNEDFEYRFTLVDSDSTASYKIDVIAPGQDAIVKTTAHMQRDLATKATLQRTLLRSPLSTRQVSAGIHAQAVRLAAKRVPFVSHPRKRESND